jgi:oligoribonuclease NrnB/cAMP/cGMP phosphodiesterase (DHH superfamily)
MFKELNFNTIFYHNPCLDGVASLWAANYYRDIPEKIGCPAGSVPPSIFNPNGKKVLFVDLCPNFNYLVELCKKANLVVVLDHHKTTFDEYKIYMETNELPENLQIYLDMDRSGCQITWDYFHSISQSRPWFIEYIGDRDLWTWKLPNSREITKVFIEDNFFDPKNLQKITQLCYYTSEQIQAIVREGASIMKVIQKQLDTAVKRAVETTINVDGVIYNVLLGTTTTADRSELGELLAEKELSSGKLPDFSATWVYDLVKNEWWISLRGSKSKCPDLSKIAKYFGGGGHYGAAAFTISHPLTLRDVFAIN